MMSLREVTHPNLRNKLRQPYSQHIVKLGVKIQKGRRPRNPCEHQSADLSYGESVWGKGDVVVVSDLMFSQLLEERPFLYWVTPKTLTGHKVNF